MSTEMSSAFLQQPRMTCLYLFNARENSQILITYPLHRVQVFNYGDDSPRCEEDPFLILKIFSQMKQDLYANNFSILTLC